MTGRGRFKQAANFFYSNRGPVKVTEIRAGGGVKKIEIGEGSPEQFAARRARKAVPGKIHEHRIVHGRFRPETFQVLDGLARDLPVGFHEDPNSARIRVTARAVKQAREFARVFDSEVQGREFAARVTVDAEPGHIQHGGGRAVRPVQQTNGLAARFDAPVVQAQDLDHIATAVHRGQGDVPFDCKHAFVRFRLRGAGCTRVLQGHAVHENSVADDPRVAFVAHVKTQGKAPV